MQPIGRSGERVLAEFSPQLKQNMYNDEMQHFCFSYWKLCSFFVWFLSYNHLILVF